MPLSLRSLRQDIVTLNLTKSFDAESNAVPSVCLMIASSIEYPDRGLPVSLKATTLTSHDVCER